MTDEISEKNWSITYWGAASAVLIAVLYSIYAVSGIALVIPLLVSAGAGLVLAASIKSGNLKRFRPAVRTASGVLTLVSGALLLYSLTLFSQAALRSTLGSIKNVISLNQLLLLVQEKFFTFAGYGFATGAMFITFTGIGVLLWDRLEEEKAVGTRKHDIYFTGILAVITLFSAFGTAFINKVPFGKVSNNAFNAYMSQGSFSGIIAGFMLVITYLVSRRAWKSLPIREMVPREWIEGYDKMKKPETIFRWLILPFLGLAVGAHSLVELRYIQVLSPLATPGSRLLMLAVLAASIAAIATVKILKVLAGDREILVRLTPYLVFGGLVYLSSFYLSAFVPQIISTFPSIISSVITQVKSSIGPHSLVMVFMTVSAAAALLLKTLISTLKGMGLIPRGLEGTMLTSAGVFFTALGLHFYLPRPNVLFAGVAASLAIWEIGKRSTILGREIGRKGSSLKTELVQLTSRLVMVIVAVIGARTLHLFVESGSFSFSPGTFNFEVVLLSVIGLGLLAYSLKEFT
jgi:hypothetical protein